MSRLKKPLGFALVGLAVFATAALAGDRKTVGDRKAARAQVDFGIRVAEQGLWKEAIYRWEKAVELDPTYAAAFNDLAIAYETAGLFDKARVAYERALQLDPKNVFVKQNFELFKELNDRANRKPTR